MEADDTNKTTFLTNFPRPTSRSPWPWPPNLYISRQTDTVTCRRSRPRSPHLLACTYSRACYKVHLLSITNVGRLTSHVFGADPDAQFVRTPPAVVCSQMPHNTFRTQTQIDQ